MEEGLTHNYIIPFANEIVSEQPWVMQSKLQIYHVQLHTPGQQNAFEESGLSKLSMFLYVHGSTVQRKKTGSLMGLHFAPFCTLGGYSDY